MVGCSLSLLLFVEFDRRRLSISVILINWNVLEYFQVPSIRQIFVRYLDNTQKNPQCLPLFCTNDFRVSDFRQRLICLSLITELKRWEHVGTLSLLIAQYILV